MFLHRLLITDIGPFAGQTRQVVYRIGNTLVKAPIGSGKSFLYFDAPLYALYKYAPRNLVNIKAKTGLIVALVECDQQIYLIRRALKKGSVKDGCTSQLYKRSESVSAFLALHDTWTTDTTFQTMMSHPSREQLIFKNESDLQQTREQLLPPREVFTSTYMLTQDADHIFQMQPAQRVEVFKHLFDLMGIDDAKDILMDHHRGLKHKITIMSDTSRADQQCRQELRQIGDFFGRLSQDSRQALMLLSQEMDRYQPLLGSLSLQQYSRDDQIDSQIVSLVAQLQLQHTDYLTIQTTASHYQQQLSDLDQTKQKLTATMNTHTQRLAVIQSLGGQDLSPGLNNLKEESQKLLLTIQQLQDALPVSTIQQRLSRHQKQLGLTTTVSDWSGIQPLLALLIQQGKYLTDQCATLEQSKQQAILQATQIIETKRQSHLQTIQQLEQEQVSLQQRLDQLILQSQRLDQDISLALHFDCTEIKKACPFVEQINTSSVLAIKQQRDVLAAQIADLQSQIITKDIPTRISQEQSALAQLTASGGTPPSLTSIEESIQRLQSQQQIIKQFLIDIQRKTLQEQLQTIKDHLERSRQLSIQIHSLQTQVDQQASLLQEQATLEALLQEQTNQLAVLHAQHDTLTTQYATLRDKLTALSGTSITQDLSVLQSIQQHISVVRRLITSYQDDKLLLQQTKEQEEIVSELVKIFAKDLMREVVRTSLPLIQEAINSYLSQVVDYELSLDLKETSSGNLELDAIITDQRGSREVKSLSGGQKVILKLAWIMAVSSFLRVRFLFLDETINNLDQETTALVSRLFESFVKKQQIAFVCITHSPEIQQINIWDEVVQL